MGSQQTWGSGRPGLPPSGAQTLGLLLLPSRCQRGREVGVEGGSRKNIDQDDRSRADLEVRTPHLPPLISKPLEAVENRETDGKMSLCKEPDFRWEEGEEKT